MDHLEFFHYHNRLIEFTYRGRPKRGVVLDIIPYGEKERNTNYAYIPYENLEIWRSASDEDRRVLQETIDIRFISRAEILRQPA